MAHEKYLRRNRAAGVEPFDDFAQVKARIMSMPERDLRQFAIAQAIQIGFHEKYGNAMSNANAAFMAEQAGNAGVDSAREPYVDQEGGLYVATPNRGKAGVQQTNSIKTSDGKE